MNLAKIHVVVLFLKSVTCLCRSLKYKFFVVIRANVFLKLEQITVQI